METNSVLSPTVGLVNIDKFISISLEANAATKDKLKEIFEGLARIHVKPSDDELVRLVRLVLDSNRCHKTTNTRFWGFERKVLVRNHTK